MDEPHEFNMLTQFLQLPNSFDLILQNSQQIEKWINELYPTVASENRHGRALLPSASFVPLSLPFQLRLIPLDDNYHNLVTSTGLLTCEKCGLQPKYPGICLLCGQLLCINSKCCSTPSSTEAIQVLEVLKLCVILSACGRVQWKRNDIINERMFTFPC